MLLKKVDTFLFLFLSLHFLPVNSSFSITELGYATDIAVSHVSWVGTATCTRSSVGGKLVNSATRTSSFTSSFSQGASSGKSMVMPSIFMHLISSQLTGMAARLLWTCACSQPHQSKDARQCTRAHILCTFRNGSTNASRNGLARNLGVSVILRRTSPHFVRHATFSRPAAVARGVGMFLAYPMPGT